MRVKNNVYINLRTDFNSAVKRIYVNFSRIIDTQRDSSFMAKLPIKLHETSIRSCIEYPYPSGFFFFFLFFFCLRGKWFSRFYDVSGMTRKWIARKGTLVTRTYAGLFRNQSATLTFTLVGRRFHFQTLAYISRVNFFDLSVCRFSSFCHNLNGKNCQFLRIDNLYSLSYQK